MAKISIEGNDLVYKTLFRKERYAIEEIQWAYIQVELRQLRTCCARGSSEDYRLVMRAQDDTEVLDLDTKKQADEVIAMLKAAKPELVTRYEKEWENAFQNDYPEFLRLSSR
ncbi:MAG: hypothetical protein LBQ97_04410 [Fusobacteriaceae bacterium]|jgi:hypothetical protein|nr:hypothetical protein [Fusobacteriaceae bacterium]